MGLFKSPSKFTLYWMNITVAILIQFCPREERQGHPVSLPGSTLVLTIWIDPVFKTEDRDPLPKLHRT